MSPEEKANLAASVRYFRTLRGLSVKELAEKAEVSTRTVINVESGNGCSGKVEERIACALNTFRSRLRQKLNHNTAINIHMPAESGRWFFGDYEEANRYHTIIAKAQGMTPSTRVDEDPEAIQDPAERFRLGTTGQASVFINIMSNQIGDGRFNLSVAEIFARTCQPPEAKCPAFLVVAIQGTLRFRQEGYVHDLSPGDSVVYLATESCSLEPKVKIETLADVPKVWVTRLAIAPKPLTN